MKRLTLLVTIVVIFGCPWTKGSALEPQKQNGTEKGVKGSFSTTATTTSKPNERNRTRDGNSTMSVTIYTYTNFFGIPWTMNLDEGCVEVPTLLYKKTSSIDTHNNCVILYGRQECEGRKVRIAPGTPGHSDLDSVDFDETLVSLESCDNAGKPKPLKKKAQDNSTTATPTTNTTKNEEIAKDKKDDKRSKRSPDKTDEDDDMVDVKGQGKSPSSNITLQYVIY